MTNTKRVMSEMKEKCISNVDNTFPFWDRSSLENEKCPTRASIHVGLSLIVLINIIIKYANKAF